MIRLSPFQKVVVGLCVFSCIALRSSDVCLAQGANEEPDVLPLSPAHVPVPRQTTGKTFVATVKWEGHEYSAADGTRVLMQAIVAPATDPGIRTKALERLSRLRNRDTTAQLVSLYDGLREREEKLGVMACLTWSEDPRGFPLFARVLEHEKDSMVRLFAAIALAQWNVRRGVAELVDLLESKEILRQPARMPYVRDNALDMFRTENRRKGWGFPDEEVQESIAVQADLDEDQKRALYIAEIEKWFAENEHRFPDWKPGDPLPEPTKPESKKPPVE